MKIALHRYDFVFEKNETIFSFQKIRYIHAY